MNAGIKKFATTAFRPSLRTAILCGDLPVLMPMFLSRKPLRGY